MLRDVLNLIQVGAKNLHTHTLASSHPRTCATRRRPVHSQDNRGGNTKTGGMAAIEQRMNSRRGRERRRAASSTYQRSRMEPDWNSKKSKFWSRILTWLGFWEPVR